MAVPHGAQAMATTYRDQDFFDLHHVREHAIDVREAVEQAGASHPRIVGSVARGDTTRDNSVDFLVSSKPSLSLFTLVTLEARLSALLGMTASVWTEEGYPPAERARSMAEAVDL